MQKVYDFVRENMYSKERNFSLFEPTPKRVFTDMNEKLLNLGLVPQGKVMFRWEGDDPMEGEASMYVLDLKSIDKIVN